MHEKRKTTRRADIIKYFDALRDLTEASKYGLDEFQHKEIIKVLKATAKHDSRLTKMDTMVLDLVLEEPEENEGFIDMLRGSERDG